MFVLHFAKAVDYSNNITQVLCNWKSFFNLRQLNIVLYKVFGKFETRFVFEKRKID